MDDWGGSESDTYHSIWVGLMTLPASEGDAIKCSTDPLGNTSNIYRYMNHRLRLYPTHTIAMSWDQNYLSAPIVNCTGVALGTSMSLSPLADLFSRANGTGNYTLNVGGGVVYNVSVQLLDGQYWMLVMMYNRRGGTNPTHWARNVTDGFPLLGNQTLGFDGSATGNRAQWGHANNR